MRRAALFLFLGGLRADRAALGQGIEKNGAVRWLIIGGQSIQPSEFAKPGFVILTAWLFAEAASGTTCPLLAARLLLLAAVRRGARRCSPISARPADDAGLGRTVLPRGLFAGLDRRWPRCRGGRVRRGLFQHRACAKPGGPLPVVQAPATRHQIDTALTAFREGGWFGRGPGEGIVTPNLPDAYTDYIFAVIAEEFGIVFCLFLVVLYGFIVWRGFRAAARSQDTFIRLALSGLMMLFGFQTLINMAVNVDLLPAKGMTLPFLSYGGSSLTRHGLDDGAGAGVCPAAARGGPHLPLRAARGRTGRFPPGG